MSKLSFINFFLLHKFDLSKQISLHKSIEVLDRINQSIRLIATRSHFHLSTFSVSGMLCLSACAAPPSCIMAGVSEEELDLSLLVAWENGKQIANLNAGYHCDLLDLSLLHPLWKETTCETVEVRSPLPGEKRITFSDKSLSQSTGDQEIIEEDTDFLERGDRALCKVVKIIETTINSSDTIIPILVGIKNKSILAKMDETFQDIVSTLESGESYGVADSSSLRINPGICALNMISEAHTVFQYFAGFSKRSPPHILSNMGEIASNQRSDVPKLQRLTPSNVYCCHKPV